ncbi:MAG: tetratricopeptide repeat protein, partial [Limisphaerales bacterium]
SIEKGLDGSAVFVLFASRESLSSLWVEFEIKESWFRVLEKKIKQSLVFIIDSSVEFSDLPAWLQRAKITKANAPKPVSRIIRDHIDDLLRYETEAYFVGRTEDVSKLQREITPPDGSPPPKQMVVFGLPGIGRRALIRHTVPFTLGLDRISVIRVQEGDELQEIAIKVADIIESFSTAAGFKSIVQKIRDSSDQENLRRVVDDLQLCIANRELPVLFDDGGLLDSQGRITGHCRRILAALPTDSDTYLFLVTKRRPNLDTGDNVPTLSVQPMTIDDRKALIAAVARRKKVPLTAGQINELSDYVEGYPPACVYAIQMAVDYGIAAVLQNKYRLVEFRTLPFLQHLTNAKLDKTEIEMLRILAEYSPLPIPVLGTALNLQSEQLAEKIMKLIDYALIVPQRNSFYAIADPIRDAVIRLTRLLLTKAEHAAVAQSLKAFIDNNDVEEHAIDAYRILFRAARNANDIPLSQHAIYLANDVIQLLERAYHSRNFEEAVKLGKEAVSLRPNSSAARGYYIRALIQEALWAEAESEMAVLEMIAPQHDALFLKGFLKRKKGDIGAAIKLFLKAIEAGRGGTAVRRELAWCYAMEGNLDEAERFLEEALHKNSDNPFVVDLGVQIAIKKQNQDLARERLAQLKEIESPAFYQHRLSLVESSFGNLERAREAAREAVKLEPKPTFEMVSQLAVCELKSNNLDEASRLLVQLERDYARKRPDFQLTLRAIVEVERRHYGNALLLLDRRVSKNDSYYYYVRKRAIDGELITTALDDAKRIAYESESKELQRLMSVTPSRTLNDILEVGTI